MEKAGPSRRLAACRDPRGHMSDVPSKQSLRLTGNSIPCLTCASRTLIQPRRGPLSSLEPRPMRRPVFWSMVRTKGSVSHPSVTRAYCENVPPSRRVSGKLDSQEVETHRLNIIVCIEPHSLLLWIVANRCENSRREVDFLSVEDVLSKWNESNSDTECFEFTLDKICHCKDMLAIGSVA